MKRIPAMKTAILQLADAGPVESTAAMLQSAGYRVFLPDDELKDILRSLGCDTVLDAKALTEGMGYDPIDFPEAEPEVMDYCDLYLDVKGRNIPKVVAQWPRLEKRSAWIRYNGGEPVITDHGGDEINPGCPIITANMWYRGRQDSYVCWVPFVRFHEYLPRLDLDVAKPKWTDPLCLIHNVDGWGYRQVVPLVRAMGVRCHGSHGSPDGLIPHSAVPAALSTALAYVSLRSNDCPGYAMYEAAAAACPMILPRRLISRMQMQDWLVEGETCLCFDGHEPTPIHPQECALEIKAALNRLRNPAENERIGQAARSRLLELMWNEGRDGGDFRAWMERVFE
jgi:hypothetical protein